MTRSARYPTSARLHGRTHAGEGLEDGYNLPGVVLCIVGVVALAAALTAAGYGYATWSVLAAIVCVVCLVAGAVWLILEHHRQTAHITGHDRQGH